MKGLYKFINWYTQHFPFPHKGWKYFKRLLYKVHLLNKTYVKKLDGDVFIYVTPTDHIQEQLFWYGGYEKKAVHTWQSFLKEGAVVFDIGANIGLYSLMAAKKVFWLILITQRH